MAIHYAPSRDARRARHRLARRRARDSRRARRASISPPCARAPYDGTCEDLFFYVDRPDRGRLRRRRRRPAAHRAQPQRHRHDDVSDAAARVRCSTLADAVLRAARRARSTLARPAPRDDLSRRTRTRSRRSRRPSRTTCSAVDRGTRARHDPARSPRMRRTNRNPLGACAITGHRLSDRSRAHERAARLRRPDRQHLRQHRDRRLSARSAAAAAVTLRRPRPLRAGHAAVVHERGRLSAAAGRVRAGQQHHAAEAQSGGARARARAAVARRSRRLHAVCRWSRTTRRSATSSTPRTICSRSSPSRLRGRDARRAPASRSRWRRRVRRRADAARARRRLGDGDGARRHARARPRPARSRSRTASPPRVVRARREQLGSVDHRDRRRRHARAGRQGSAADATTRWRALLSPEHFVAVRRTHGGPAPDVTTDALDGRGAAASTRLTTGERSRVVERQALQRRGAEAVTGVCGAQLLDRSDWRLPLTSASNYFTLGLLIRFAMIRYAPGVPAGSCRQRPSPT